MRDQTNSPPLSPVEGNDGVELEEWVAEGKGWVDSKLWSRCEKGAALVSIVQGSDRSQAGRLFGYLRCFWKV